MRDQAGKLLMNVYDCKLGDKQQCNVINSKRR